MNNEDFLLIPLLLFDSVSFFGVIIDDDLVFGLGVFSLEVWCSVDKENTPILPLFVPVVGLIIWLELSTLFFSYDNFLSCSKRQWVQYQSP